MPTNDEIKKGNDLLNEQIEIAGVIDNAFKSIAANISTAFEEVADSLQGIDTVGQKIAKSYERDIVGSIKKISAGLEENVKIQLKINKGVNVQAELDKKVDELRVRAKLTLQKINQENGLSVEQKKELRKQLLGQFGEEKRNLEALKKQNETRQKQKGLVEEISDSLGDQLDKFDKSGTASALLKGNLDKVAGSAKIAQAFLLGFGKALLAGNKSTTQLQKDLLEGISNISGDNNEESE